MPMWFELYDRVRIKTNGTMGIIVDISKQRDRIVYIVESDTHEMHKGAYPSHWPLYDCAADELEAVRNGKTL